MIFINSPKYLNIIIYTWLLFRTWNIVEFLFSYYNRQSIKFVAGERIAFRMFQEHSAKSRAKDKKYVQTKKVIKNIIISLTDDDSDGSSASARNYDAYLLQPTMHTYCSKAKSIQPNKYRHLLQYKHANIPFSIPTCNLLTIIHANISFTATIYRTHNKTNWNRLCNIYK